MFKVCFLNEKYINLVFCVFCLIFFIVVFMFEVFVFFWFRIIKKIYVFIYSFFYGVCVIFNFLWLNWFCFGVICGLILYYNKLYNFYKNCIYVVLKIDCLR